MTQQDKRKKWLCYALGVLPLWVAELFLLNRVPLFGVRPVLLPLAAVAAGLWEGSGAGAWFGLAVGILADGSYPALPGGMTLGLAVLGWLCGVFAEHGIGQSFVGYLICSAVSYSALELFRVLTAALGGLAGWGAAAWVACKEGLWSLCFTLPIYLLFRAVYRRVGGQKLGS